MMVPKEVHALLLVQRRLVDKLCHGFLWVGQSDAKGGNCLVAWDSVCQPKTLGGLGFHNLRWLNASLRARWAWLQRTSPGKPWSGLELAISEDARALFEASVRITVGNGESVLFWEDPWLAGHSVKVLAPAVLALVRPSCARSRTVKQGRPGNRWALDIVGALTVDAVVQFLRLWTMVQQVELSTEVTDRFAWKHTTDGEFSTRSCYLACFAGRTAYPGVCQVWNSFAPAKWKFFGWLAVRGRCWTADRLTRRGLTNHGVCPLCRLRGETLDHLLLQCVYSRCVWIRVLREHGLQHLSPASTDRLTVWWPSVEGRVARPRRRAANSLILLTLRSIWMERNDRVFEDKACPTASLAARITSEWRQWTDARGRTQRGIG
jgi:hypothetical protein